MECKILTYFIELKFLNRLIKKCFIENWYVVQKTGAGSSKNASTHHFHIMTITGITSTLKNHSFVQVDH